MAWQGHNFICICGITAESHEESRLGDREGRTGGSKTDVLGSKSDGRFSPSRRMARYPRWCICIVRSSLGNIGEEFWHIGQAFLFWRWELH